MNNGKEDIYAIKERLDRACSNNMELRGALKEIVQRCEEQLRQKMISSDCLRLATDVLHICRCGGM